MDYCCPLPRNNSHLHHIEEILKENEFITNDGGDHIQGVRGGVLMISPKGSARI